MVRRNSRSRKSAPPRARRDGGLLRLARWLHRWWRRGLLGLAALVALAVIWVMSYSVINPPLTHFIWSEQKRLNAPVARQWVALDDIAPVMARSVVAAEDANFCLHWGFDMQAIRAALDAGGRRGASTISQQVVKNAFLWHGRSWARKALEAVLTPVVEATWSKRRILEVYLNIAEFDEGVFGVGAASRHYFGVEAAALTPTQAARLAMVLPSPKTRSASTPTQAQRRRSAAILDGAETIRRDGRAGCFER